MSVNSVHLVGRLGKDPEQKSFDGGNVTTFSIVTSKKWKDKNTGETKEKATWHNITAWNRLGEICAQYLKKGSRVFIAGSIENDEYQADDGSKRRVTKILASDMQMLETKSEIKMQESPPESHPVNNTPQFDDDIPF